MNSQIKNYFITTKILLQNEIEYLNDFFDATIKKNPNTNLYFLDITLNKILPIDIYSKFFDIHISTDTDLTIVISQKTLNFDKKDLVDYLSFFANKILNLSDAFHQIINSKGIDKINNDIIIKYFNNHEKSIIQNHLELLKKLFIDAGFKFDNLIIDLDKNRQEESINTNLQQAEINELFKKNLSINFKLEKTKLDNHISSKTITPIKDINEELSQCVFEGQIFKIEKHSIKDNRYIYIFSITDYESGIKARAFTNTINHQFNGSVSLSEQYLDIFKNNEWVRIQCKLTTDKFNNNELVALINKIEKIKTPSKFIVEDKLENKRSELLMHTKMSAFDGISSVDEIYDHIHNLGWNAIGIVDRNNVQSFPLAYANSKKYNIKTLYGIELNLLNEDITLANNTKDIPLKDCTYVIFDIETSGLYNEFDDLIEFAAIKVKDKKKIDEINFFIKPPKSISNFISQKTHITNETLNEEGKPLVESLKIIQDWIKDCVLIAHNGLNFDYRFLNKKFAQNNLPIITNPIIDTMQVSRLVNENLTKHNLGVISHLYHLEYNENIAHRANFDTNILFSVWKIMYEKLINLGITNLSQLQTISNETYWSRQFADNFAILYCKNQQSFYDLYKLVSYANTKNLFGTPRIFNKELKEYRESFIIANHPTESNVFDFAINGTDQDLIDVINFYDVIFIPTPSQLLHMFNSNGFSIEQCQETIKKIIKFAQKLNKLIVAVSDAYYLKPWEQIARKVYINSKLLGGKSHRLFSYESNNEIIPDNHLRTTEEMIKEFSFLHKHELVNEIVITNSQKFVKFFPDHLSPLKDKLYAPVIENVEQKLTDYVNMQLREIYGDKLSPIIEKRVQTELQSIISNGYSIVYWISHLLVLKSLEDGYLVGSRGSVGSSFVAYLLKITEVNPLQPHYICSYCHHIDFNVQVDDGFDLPNKKCPICGKEMKGDGHNIPFEIFLGFHGEKIPDIDLNFSGEYQAKAHEFIRSMFGKEHSYRAGTISSVASKTAYGYVKNFFEKTQTNNLINSAYIDWLTLKCSDVKRTTGQHPGGIIIVPKNMEIFDFTPYNYPADDKSSSWFTSHFPYDDLHNNLLKFDILGHDDPTKLKYLEELTGVNPRSIPFYDEQVMSLFTSNKVLGINDNDIMGEPTGAIGLPEFGTEFVRKILIDSQPKAFADLIRISGLSHGTNVWLNNAQDLIKQNHLTLSQVVSCRDDIMTNLMSLGIEASIAFSVMESVRKGKGIKPKDLEILHQAKIPEWYIETCKKILYLFPKAHATAYVFNAWRIAWFKLYYPQAFYASYFTINFETFDLDMALSSKEQIEEKIRYIRNAKHNKSPDLKKVEEDKLPCYEVMLEMLFRGFKFKTISIEKSDAHKFIVDGKYLIPPFSVITSCGTVAANKIVEERKTKFFASKEDLIKRCGLSTSIIAEMSKHGILDSLRDEDQMSLFDV